MAVGKPATHSEAILCAFVLEGRPHGGHGAQLQFHARVHRFLPHRRQWVHLHKRIEPPRRKREEQGRRGLQDQGAEGPVARVAAASRDVCHYAHIFGHRALRALRHEQCVGAPLKFRGLRFERRRGFGLQFERDHDGQGRGGRLHLRRHGVAVALLGHAVRAPALRDTYRGSAVRVRRSHAPSAIVVGLLDKRVGQGHAPGLNAEAGGGQ
mmetsp:Transcript_127244/g.368414  ORF Transcript_127244/g.368414 Transcript_127244/m.368414 type:complete len:210 (-) Transcript_127244:106-735(-)